MDFKKENKMKHDFYQSLNLPLIAAPMFLISGPKMVIECCKNGIVGTFPALNQRTTEGFEQWVVEIKDALEVFEKETGKKAAPYGVNLIVHPSNIRIKADLEVCAKHQVPLVITSLGAIADLVKVVHAYGGLVYHDIIKKRHADKAAEAGVDGLIVVAAGAGGHAGTLHPIPLIQEVKKVFDKTIVLSGCLSNGNDIASALQMGADMAYMGTRFINVQESMADENYRKMIVESSAEDIVYTAVVSGVNANFLKPSLEAMGIGEEQWKSSKKIDFGNDLDTASAEAKAWKTIWSAGQGVSAINDIPSISQLVTQLKSEFRLALERQQKLLDQYPSQ
ncbi:MAG: nitronate monooxygenase [Flavobacteriia bacterium]|nr:nitronate monooxygenase [Flavobacteriia bacterium]